MAVTLTAHCRTVTPMTAGGADPWQHFELRAAEVKSALRFWWRAFHPFDDRQEMFIQESRVFGGKNDQGEPIAAPFRLTVLNVQPNGFFEPGRGEETFIDQEGKEKKKPILGNDVQNEWGEGLRYVFYAILHHRGRIHNIATKAKGRQVAKEGLSFELRFTFLRGGGEVIAEVLRALWLLMNLGGLGSRSRRGAGCFVITRFSPSLNTLSLADVPEFFHTNFTSPAPYLQAGLAVILQKWFPSPLPTYTAEPPYTAFRPGVAEIHVYSRPNVGFGRGALHAMDAVGCMMKSYRYINPRHEAQEMHAALHRGTKPKITHLTKAQMGLPIIYNFRGPNDFGKAGKPAILGGYTAKGIKVQPGSAPDFQKEENNKENAERRASPVLISCHDFKGTPYAVVCHFPAPLLPDGQKIWLKAKDGYANSHHICDPPPNYDFVDQLIKGTDKSLDKGFKYLTSIYERDSKTAATGVCTPDGQPSPSPEPPAEPAARKLFYLQQAEARPDGLSWSLGEISGPVQGQKKKARWPCRLWNREGDRLVEEPGPWWLRLNKVPASDRGRLRIGTVFLCTNQADPQTPNTKNYLYHYSPLR